jgi:hypothetical protein
MAIPVLARDRYNAPIQALAPGTVQAVTTATGASAATATALAVTTVVVRVVSTTDCYLAIGTGTPTASSASLLLPASTPEYFRVSGGDTIKVAALAVTAAGLLNVTEMA